MKTKNNFKPGENLLGGYHELDGTIEFYGRINSILKASDSVLDLGAGRGAWYSLDNCSYRREIRDLKKKVKYFVGIDVDDTVLENPTTHNNIIMSLGKIPLENNSMDIVIADWVLEHIRNTTEFTLEINRVLKPGGRFLCFFKRLIPFFNIPELGSTHNTFPVKLVFSKKSFPKSPVPHATSINFFFFEGAIQCIRFFFHNLWIPKDIKSFIRSYLS